MRIMRTWIKRLCVLVAIALLFTPLMAGANDSPTGYAPQADDLSVWEQATQWVLAKQRELHRELSTAMQAVREAPELATITTLILISFFYGIFHAAGPGHGKAVITTYLLTHHQQLRRGVWLSFLSAIVQGVSAIVLVFVLVKLFGWLTRDALAQADTVERFSFILVSLLGLWLVWRGGKPLWAHLRRPKPTPSTPPPTPASARVIPIQAAPQQATPTPTHSAHCGCGNAHHIDPRTLDKADRKTMLLVVLAVGMRPCTGALVVLAVAHLLNLWLAGVMAVLAMSLGTAITVSLLAVIAVKARHLASRLVGGEHSRWPLLGHFAALAGGLLILFIGLTLLYGSTVMPPPPTHPFKL